MQKVSVPHIRNANYRVAQWKKAQITIFDVPPATSHGWVEGDDGFLEPIWSDGPVLPPTLVDVLVRDEMDDEAGQEEQHGEIMERKQMQMERMILRTC